MLERELSPSSYPLTFKHTPHTDTTHTHTHTHHTPHTTHHTPHTTHHTPHTHTHTLHTHTSHTHTLHTHTSHTHTTHTHITHHIPHIYIHICTHPRVINFFRAGFLMYISSATKGQLPEWMTLHFPLRKFTLNALVTNQRVRPYVMNGLHLLG